MRSQAHALKLYHGPRAASCDIPPQMVQTEVPPFGRFADEQLVIRDPAAHHDGRPPAYDLGLESGVLLRAHLVISVYHHEREQGAFRQVGTSSTTIRPASTRACRTDMFEGYTRHGSMCGVAKGRFRSLRYGRLSAGRTAGPAFRTT
jgi:hypothetical protein